MASIRKHRNKWQARVKRGGIVAEKSFQLKRDAELWARRTEAQIEIGSYKPTTHDEPVSPAMLGDILRRFGSEIASHHRSATTAINVMTLIRALGKVEIEDLDAQVVARWRDKRLTEVQPASVARELNTLSAILNHARREWCLPVPNPVKDIRRPRDSPHRARRLLPDELERLFSTLPGRWVPIVQLALATAMRRGELLSLEWQHIDFKRHVAFLPITKNGFPRKVPLSSAAMKVLTELRPANDGGLPRVFPITHAALDKAWRKACKAAAITDLHFHDLRHEAISRYFELGLNVMEVASISGHRSLAMLQRYTHLKAEDIARKIE